jgi:hypothetical protein
VWATFTIGDPSVYHSIRWNVAISIRGGEPWLMRYCWRPPFKILGVLFLGKFPQLFSFKEGMGDTQISTLLRSPTVSSP